MLAIIGGTGLYDLPEMTIDAETEEDTPFGRPSAPLVRGHWGRHSLLFLARHGRGHRLLPHEINYRANIFALKRAGATQVLGLSAVGSLAEVIAPGDLALPTQYFDWTRGSRERTFFGGGVAAHVSTAQPVSRNLVDWIAAGAATASLRLHRDLNYACVEGPRLGTRLESQFLRQSGCHLVGMTNVPEVFLAREAQLCYASIGIVTDYDCWMEDPAHHVSVAAIFERYGRSLDDARRLLAGLLAQALPEEEPETRDCLRQALMTPDDALDDVQRAWLHVLRR